MKDLYEPGEILGIIINVVTINLKHALYETYTNITIGVTI
jgi:hypothetical protein